MKKYKLLTIAAILITMISLNGCKKEEVTDIKVKETSISETANTTKFDFKVSVVDDRLVFDTREDYEKSISYLASIRR